jgi:hypothetical protein
MGRCGKWMHFAHRTIWMVYTFGGPGAKEGSRPANVDVVRD